MDNHKEKMKALQKEQREKVKSKTIDRGIIIVNTGDCKGKSTAAFGTAIRAVGYGYKVTVIQFIKGTWNTGEQEVLNASMKSLISYLVKALLGTLKIRKRTSQQHVKAGSKPSPVSKNLVRTQNLVNSSS